MGPPSHSWIRLLIYITMATTVYGNRKYVLTAPNQIFAGQPYKVTLAMGNVSMPTDVQVSLNVASKTPVPVVAKTVRFQNRDTSEMVELMAPANPSPRYASYDLTISFSDGGTAVTDRKAVPVTYTNGFLMIQTDKGIYKRGQTVKFRVVSLDDGLMPKADNITIYIKDSDDNRVQLFRNQKPMTGVVKAEFELSDDPMLGNWTIVAETDSVDKLTSQVNFLVDEFVLPRFEVTLDAPSSLVRGSRNPVTVKVTARYTYGEPVTGKGMCTIKSMATGQVVKESVTLPITLRSGEMMCEFTAEALGLSDTQTYMVQVKGEVTESGTETVIEEMVSVPVVRPGAKLTIKTADVYVPHTPMFVCVQVTDHADRALQESESAHYTLEVKVNSLTTTATQLTDMKLDGGKTKCQEFNPKVTTQGSLTVQASLRHDTDKYKSSEVSKQVSVYKAGMTPPDPENPSSSPPIVANQSIQVLLWDKANVVPRVDEANSVLRAGDKAEFKVYTFPQSGAFPSLHYQVVSRGRQVTSGDVILSSDATFSIDVTAEMTPAAHVVVYGVTTSGLVVVATSSFKVTGALRNQASMSFSTPRASVKDNVTLTLTSEPDSYVALVAVDYGSLLLADPEDITEQKVMKFLQSQSKVSTDQQGDDVIVGRGFWYNPEKSTYDIFTDAGLLIMSDGHISKGAGIFPDYDGMIMEAMAPGGNEILRKDGSTQTTSDTAADDSGQVRKNFPETWIWLDSYTSSNGQYSHTVQLPDSITTWVTRAFVISSTSGLGIPENAQVEAFKDFFVTMELPASAIRGEKFVVKLIVFSYITGSDSVNAEVTLKDSDDYVMWRKTGSDPSQPYGDDTDLVETVAVPSGGNAVINVWINPSTVGDIEFHVTAKVDSANSIRDSIIKQMNIQPEGRPVEFSRSILVESGQIVDNATVPVVINRTLVVPDSTSIVVSRVGDIMGQVLTNPERLLTVPFGCGEQNMITLVPNIFVLKYMQGIGKAGQEMTTKAQANIRRGYQRELRYKHEDGSFSAFGKSDGSGSTWLTAFVLRSFAQAHAIMPDLVDVQIIAKALEWLANQYDPRDKVFKEPGRVIHTEMQGGTQNAPEKLTAYVMMALAESLKEFDLSGHRPIKDKVQNYTDIVKGHLEQLYGSGRIDKSNAYTLSMMAYSLSMVSSSLTNNIVSDLEKLAIDTPVGSVTHTCWLCGRDVTTTPRVNRDIMPYPRQATPSAIETTAYAMLTYLARGDRTAARPIMRWLNSQRNSLGGYGSTQDTVMGLFAMSEFSQATGSGQVSLDISVQYTLRDGRTMSQNFPVINNADEKLINRKIQLPADTTSVTVSSSGSGDAVVTVRYKYNVDIEDENPDIVIVVDVQEENSGKIIHTSACVRYLGTEESGMTLVRMKVPTGYQADVNDVQKVRRAELGGEGTVDLYLDEVTRTETCVRVKSYQEMEVADYQHSAVQAMLYYKPHVQNTVFYNVGNASMYVKPSPQCTGATCGSGYPVMLMSLLCGSVILVVITKYLH